MTQSLLSPPTADPAPVLELLDQQYGSYILAAAIEHFGIFDRLAERPGPKKRCGPSWG